MQHLAPDSTNLHHLPPSATAQQHPAAVRVTHRQPSGATINTATRLLIVGLAWLAAGLGSLLSLFAAYIGRADFGDGGASQMSVPAAAALVVLAIAAPVAAWLITRRLLRPSSRPSSED